MVTFADIVRQEIPGVTDSEIEYVLWEHTGYPTFWIDDPEAECRCQVRQYASARAVPPEVPRD